ncbi:HD domain-containing protein [Clostridium malenominatum]|uniref:HD domain-containing protein n=1 Tax=Clostridium malenominatum TaxID=1539 RepID=A0ABN1J8I1_9CLOT
MNMYRVKQFFLYIFDNKMKKEDYIYLCRYLNKIEIDMFKRLSVKDQKHSIRVAISMEKICANYKDINKDRLIKISLLHDIGKVNCKLSIIDKCALVFLDSITKGGIAKYSNIKKIYIYYNHGEEGYNILKNMEYDKEFLNTIRNHHNRNIINEELNILRQCDEIN